MAEESHSQKSLSSHAVSENTCPSLDNGTLEQIWYVLAHHADASADGAGCLDYDRYCQAGLACRELAGQEVERFFAPSVFGRLPKDAHGTAGVMSFFEYIMRSNAMIQTRYQLANFDEDMDGSLTPKQLEKYLRQLLSELPGLFAINSRLPAEAYMTIVSRKFLLMHQRKGRIQIKELLPSESLSELLQARSPQLAGQSSQNWFSLESASCLYERFCSLDADGSGTLSQQEFAEFSSHTMTPYFIARLFEEHAASKAVPPDETGIPPDSVWSTTQLEMGLAEFCDFVLAWEHRSTPEGVAYFFPLMDLQRAGHITQVDIYQFLKDLLRMWLACGQYPELVMEDVKDEIFDIVKPADPLHITAKDFLEYDNRETLLPIEDSGVAIVRVAQ